MPRELSPLETELLRELQSAHLIILNALGLMTTDQQIELGMLNAREGVDGEGVTRHYERAQVIAKATGAA